MLSKGILDGCRQGTDKGSRKINEVGVSLRPRASRSDEYQQSIDRASMVGAAEDEQGEQVRRTVRNVHTPYTMYPRQQLHHQECI